MYHSIKNIVLPYYNFYIFLAAFLTATPLHGANNDNSLTFGLISLSKKTLEITFPAKVGDPDGIIEYLVVNNFGKIHESLFYSNISATNLNIAMKLAGYKESKELFTEIDADGIPKENTIEVAQEIKNNARFDIFVEWELNDKKHHLHVNSLILNNSKQKQAELHPYIYNGSYLIKGKLIAESQGDLIGVYTDVAAIANFSNKGHDDDTLWYPYWVLCPPIDTPVTIIIKKHQIGK